jgi:hypothetical protein
MGNNPNDDDSYPKDNDNNPNDNCKTRLDTNGKMLSADWTPSAEWTSTVTDWARAAVVRALMEINMTISQLKRQFTLQHH